MTKRANKIYGYARISTSKQSIDRQIRNIKNYNSKAIVIEEAFTGTKVEGREQFQKLIKTVKEGDTIIFDSVSRMSRNAKEGFELYKELFNRGINLEFIKEQYINTDVYKQAIENQIAMTNTEVDILLEAIKKYLLALAEKQIIIAFEQAEKEVKDLQQRTKEGIETARINGKQIGRVEGSKVVTKKSIEAKEQIKKYSKSFNGNLTDVDVIKLIGINKKTYYKYKKEMLEEA